MGTILRIINFILISFLSINSFAQTPVQQARKYLENQTTEELLFVSVKKQELYHIKNVINITFVKSDYT